LATLRKADIIQAMSQPTGLRERKKHQTREAIADAAWHLFLDRGFDNVTVADVARAADVSEATVFNYFPTKEDLAYHRMEDFEDELLEAIANRDPAMSVVDAFGTFVLEPRGFLKTGADIRHGDPLAVTRIFTESPALLARERQIYDRYADRLIDLIAQERRARRDDLEPLVIARALISLHRAMIDHVRQRVLAGASTEAIRREIRSRGARAFALLKTGFDGALPPTRSGRR
jgi:AcrR family transcriptional regulator